MPASPPKILLLNPPHSAIGSRICDEHLPPLGLLAIGERLLDAGFAVELLDADGEPLAPDEIVRRIGAAAPRIAVLGYAGSPTAPPGCADLALRIKTALPVVTIVYGSVSPTCHWRGILTECPAIDVIVRGEGERTTVLVARALVTHGLLATVPGCAYRDGAQLRATRQAKLLADFRGSGRALPPAAEKMWQWPRPAVLAGIDRSA